MYPEFKWVPGTEMDLNAIEYMKHDFYKPPEAPPEAWFMSDTQKYFTALAESPINEIENSYFEEFLFDTGSGIKSFGRWRMWVDWFLYLLPYLLLRLHDKKANFTCEITNYLLNLYPYEIFDECPGYREYLFRTLCQSIMAPSLWENQDLVEKDKWYDDPGFVTGFSHYALLFFCLKYLTPKEIPAWVASIAAIKDEFWHQEIAIWMASAAKFCDYLAHPEKAPRQDNDEEIDLDQLMEAARINWWESHAYALARKPSYAQTWPLENIEAFWAAVKQHPEFNYQPPAE